MEVIIAPAQKAPSFLSGLPGDRQAVEAEARVLLSRRWRKMEASRNSPMTPTNEDHAHGTRIGVMSAQDASEEDLHVAGAVDHRRLVELARQVSKKPLISQTCAHAHRRGRQD